MKEPKFIKNDTHNTLMPQITKDFTSLTDERLNQSIKFGHTKKLNTELLNPKQTRKLIDQDFQSDSQSNVRYKLSSNNKRTLLESPLNPLAYKKQRQPQISYHPNHLYSPLEAFEPSSSHSEPIQTPGKDHKYAKRKMNIRSPEEVARTRVVRIDEKIPDLINHDLNQSEDKERGWEIESDDPAKFPSNPNEERDESLEKAKKVIHEIDHPWKMVFDEAAGSIKADFRKIATHIDHLFANDATLAEDMCKELQMSLITCTGSKNKVMEESGEVLEALVQLQNSNDEIEIKLRELDSESETFKKEFLQELSKYEAKHRKEIEEMRSEIDAETEAFESLIKSATSDKNEKKDMQKRLAVLLADET
ncbi:hypothetical protein DFH28DRAFT_967717 [Melampsora americana]|nr:hypothetical protein DFH28DRAFT_967717 [Melampsora americana]